MKRGASHTPGFTIVELLIVIVVIAILAAVTVVAYTGIQQRADEAVVSSDITKISKAMELWKLDNNEQYPTTAQLDTLKLTVSRGSYLQTGRNNIYYCRSADGLQYSFGLVSKHNQGYFLTTGEVKRQSAAGTFQSNTCAQVGEPSASGVTGYIWSTATWASWIGG